MGDYVDLESSYLEIESRLHSTAANGIVANTNHASDANNTKHLYVTNNIGHTLFKQMNLYLNGIVISAQTNTYAYDAFFETLLNYNRDEGETLLTPQGWVNYFNVEENLTRKGRFNDVNTTDGWQHNQSNPLKTATMPIRGNNRVIMHVRPHLDAFWTGPLLVPWVEIKLVLFCNTPEFFMYGTTLAAKCMVTLKAKDLKVKWYLCCVSLNTNVYNELKEQREADGHPARSRLSEHDLYVRFCRK